MYPDFQYFFNSLFNTDVPAFLGYIKTFGFFVGIAFLVAAWMLTRELKRKEGLGLLSPTLLPVDKAKKFVRKEDATSIQNGLVKVYPHQRVGEIVFIALIGGLVGAKIFNALETWKDFVNDPIGSLFSGSGLTFYGGLIVAALLIYLYCRKHKFRRPIFVTLSHPP
jgi:phosphatidylglycerol---prolipoprotein diacylglyceryl transferase